MKRMLKMGKKGKSKKGSVVGCPNCISHYGQPVPEQVTLTNKPASANAAILKQQQIWQSQFNQMMKARK